MKREDFISGLQDELELDTQLSEETDLKQLDNWDSMAAMLVIGYVAENFDLTLNADDIKGVSTVSSLIDRIGADKFN